MIRLEPVIGALPACFTILRAEARAEGHRMLDALADEWAEGRMRFDRPGEALLAAYFGQVLAGVGGLTIETALPAAFRMRRFYVRAAFRRAGVGRALAGALIERCIGETITLNAASGSEAFWEALGFVPDKRDARTHIRRC